MSYSYNQRKKAIKRGKVVVHPKTGELCKYKKTNNVWKLVPLTSEATTSK